MASIIVIGAGLSGLAAAWRFLQAGHDVVVLEALDRVGGVISTTTSDELTMERGPQSFRAGAVHSLQWLDKLGLRWAILPASSAARQPWLLWNNQLYPLPKALLNRQFLPTRTLLRALLEPVIADIAPESDESVYDFFTRHFGRRIAERIADPLVAGVFGGDAHELSIQAAFPDLASLESSYSSVLAGALFRRRMPRPAWAPKQPFTLQGGLQLLPQRLAQLIGEHIRLNSPVSSIESTAPGFRVHAPGGPYEAEHVIVAVPPRNAAAFSPIYPDVLAGMPTTNLASVVLAWPASTVQEPLQGFGWLTPSSSRKDVLGMLAISCCFPEHFPGHVAVRWMFGGSRENIGTIPDEALLGRAQSLMKVIHQVDVAPTHVDIHRAAIPQYTLGHLGRIQALQTALPGLHWLGWGYTGIGLEHQFKAVDTLTL